jgi:hypothetical protein
VAYRASTPRGCTGTLWTQSTQYTTVNTVAAREKVSGREKERGRGIKYGIVSIEYEIEII